MRPLAALAIFLTTACAGIRPERGHDEVAKLVEERSGRKTFWERGTPEDEALYRHVTELLARGLTRERAAEIALANNPRLQQAYEALGISQADMVQAWLPKNPSIGGHVGFPTTPVGITEYSFSLVQDLLDLVVLPWRKDFAEQQFQVDVLGLAHEALVTVAEAQKQLAEYQAAGQRVELERVAVEAAEGQALLADLQFRANNISPLELAIERTAYQRARLDLAHAELEANEHREKLNKLLGLWGPQTRWKLAEELTPPPIGDPPLEKLESLAIRQRLDIAAARGRTAVLGKAMGLARGSRFFGFIDVGVDFHQDADGPRTLGPSLSIELPIFDQRAPTIARLEAQQRRAERLVAELSVDARADVRLAWAALSAARQIAEHYRDVLVPLQQQVLEQSQLFYNGMLIGAPRLLQVKRDLLETQRAYLDARRDYWVARAELEEKLGGRLP